MPPTPNIIISLTPDKLTGVHIRRGAILQTEVIDLDPSQWEENLASGMMRLDSPLRQLLSRFPTRSKGRAILLYHSPSHTKQVYTIEATPSIARETACSNIRENIGFGDPVEASVLDSAGGEHDAQTVIAYSDKSEALRAAYAWLSRCGLHVQSLLPMSVAAVRAATRAVQGVDEQTVVFYFCSDVSVMVYASQGRLQLVRPADIGYRKLANSYAQVFSDHAEQQQEAESQSEFSDTKPLKPDVDSMGMLFEYGIPFQSVEVGGIDLRNEVMPCLAPIMQRICIDIKQTLRFGIGSDSDLKHLLICGPGASIPGLSKAVGEHLDLHIRLDEGEGAFSPDEVAGSGSLELAIVESQIASEGLLPDVAKDAQTQSKLNRALLAGGAVAAIVMGAQYSIGMIEMRHWQSKIDQDASRLSAVNEFKEMNESARQVSQALFSVAELVTNTTSSFPQWEGPLSQLGQMTGDSIRIQEMRGEQGEDGPFIQVNGFAVAPVGQEGGAVLNEFVTRVREISGVHEVSLGATSRIEIRDQLNPMDDETVQWGLQFSIQLKLDSTPSVYQSLANASRAKSTGGKP